MYCIFLISFSSRWVPPLFLQPTWRAAWTHVEHLFGTKPFAEILSSRRLSLCFMFSLEINPLLEGRGTSSLIDETAHFLFFVSFFFYMQCFCEGSCAIVKWEVKSSVRFFYTTTTTTTSSLSFIYRCLFLFFFFNKRVLRHFSYDKTVEVSRQQAPL